MNQLAIDARKCAAHTRTHGYVYGSVYTTDPQNGPGCALGVIGMITSGDATALFFFTAE